MENYYLILLGFLAIIAVFDLFVGVSNDAVNFLNSALGCRIASFRTTMWVASIGVMLGATFSSGMMEIARSGVFHPQMFSFAEIMVIFFAVMVTDIILLDAFNSLGLPTSTTVSIVFELLGSAVAAACFKLVLDGASLADVVTYINSSKALAIISGILISVVVAFITGSIVQFIARLIFSFHFENAYRRFGAIFGGIAITAIVYFLIMKGAKGASFMRPEWLAWIKANTGTIVLTLFVSLTVLFQVLILTLRINIFKIVILAGTFSLAFAFAGNDLVNFVGVPLAAYDSWREWQASGVSDQTFMMGGLLKPTVAPTFFLLGAGLVMVLTLWFSRKAYRVIQTSINLSASNAGEQELFGSSLPGRLIVRTSLGVGKILHQIIPMPIQRGISSRFTPRTVVRGEVPLPFDYVRASINLVVSAILIASATSLKLPLSTTYVTFMVAMGSSFADGAWDRESAVYRISGVLTVTSGWFLTALCASSLAAIVCLAVLWGGEYMAVVLGLLGLGLLIRSNLKTSNESNSIRVTMRSRYDVETVQKLVNEKSSQYLLSTVSIFSQLVGAFFEDNESRLRKIKRNANDLLSDLGQDRGVYYKMANTEHKASGNDFEARYCYYRIFTNMREVSRSLQNLTNMSTDHVANRHLIHRGAMQTSLEELTNKLLTIILRPDGHAGVSLLREHAQETIELIDSMQIEFLRQIPQGNISARGCELYLNFLLFARELLNHYEIAAVIQDKLNNLPQKSAG